MKLLFITTMPLEFNSSATLQNIALIKGFIELGYEVDILTTKVLKNDKNFDATISNKITINKQYEVGIGSIYSSVRDKNEKTFKSLIKRKVKNFFGWFYKRIIIYDGFKLAVKNLKYVQFDDINYNIVISASDPKSSHLLAEEFFRLYPKLNCRWIQYWGDPMYLDITKKSFLRKRLYKEEKRIISKADEVIYVSPMTYDKQIQLYKEYKDIIRFIPLGYIEKKYDNPHNCNINVGYYGYYYTSARNIYPFYTVAKNSNYKFRIVGEGDIELLPANNIELYSRMSYEKVEKFETETEILICLCNNKSTQIPGKLYYYSATTKPVLVILDGNKTYLYEYLKTFNRFVFCENNPKDIEMKINEIMLGKHNHLFKPVEELYCKNICAVIENKKIKRWVI